MISRLQKFIGICLLAYPFAGLAGPQATYEDERTIKAQLEKSIHQGMTIDEAIAQRIEAAPQQGDEITRVALNMYRRLPQTACAMRAKDGGMRLSVWPDFKACGDRIVRAAIKAGVDPIKITSASAAGSNAADPVLSQNQASDSNARKTFGVDLYLLRQIFLGSAY